MGCTGCSVTTSNGKPGGCRSNGSCSTGGCNRLNTYDWLATQGIDDYEHFDIVEVSFKNGAHKGFYRNGGQEQLITGDPVVVESGNGYDVGHICLSGELVRMQMRKKKMGEDAVLLNIIRKANERDLEKLAQARKLEKATMIRARAIARTLGLDMKIGDVEYQGDKRKATFYYTADGRVDFRELIRHYAKEFRVKIEMRQIGARQESARIGGLGSCGRELCCSTWLTDFKSVSTSAARYQNLAINQSKLSGQCGRLKCCLNYELDTYLEALEAFPRDADRLKTGQGVAVLVKTDIFKKIMYYTVDGGAGRGGKLYVLTIAQVNEIKKRSAAGDSFFDLHQAIVTTTPELEDEEMDFGDVTGAVELPPEERKYKKKKNRNRKGSNARSKNQQGEKRDQSKKQPNKMAGSGKNTSAEKPAEKKEKSNKPAGKNRNRRKSRKNRNKKSDQ